MSARARHAWLVTVAALAGLALAVALAVLTSHLTAQHVGLAGEPSRPAPGLVAPAITTETPPANAPTTTTTTTTPVAPAQENDHEQGDD